MNVSVVVPVKNSERTIAATVESLLEQSYRAGSLEILLVGDPDDRTWSAVEEHLASGSVKRLEIAVRSAGRDANAKRNLGLRHATGDVLCLTDSDMVLPRDWVERGVALIESGRPCVAGPMRSVAGGFWGEYTDHNGIASKTPRMREPYVVDRATFGRGRMKPPITANVFFTRELYEAVGGLDDAFVYSYEDYEWFFRVVESGFAILCTDELAAAHFHRQGFGDLLREYRRSGRGCAQFIRKHPRCSFARKRLAQVVSVFAAPAVCAPVLVAVPSALAAATAATLAVALEVVNVARARRLKALAFPVVTFALGLSFSFGLAYELGRLRRRRGRAQQVERDLVAA